MSDGVVLVRGEATLDLRQPAHLCPKWDRLLAAPPKQGANRQAPGVRGSKIRRRVAGELREILQIEIDGYYDVDGSAFDGDPAENAYMLVDLVNDFLDDDDPCTITVHRLGVLDPLVGVLQVEDPGPPIWVTEVLVRFAVDVTLPDGRLTVAET